MKKYEVCVTNQALESDNCVTSCSKYLQGDPLLTFCFLLILPVSMPMLMLATCFAINKTTRLEDRKSQHDIAARYEVCGMTLELLRQIAMQIIPPIVKNRFEKRTFGAIFKI